MTTFLEPLALSLLTVLLLCPDDAWAWGPSTHLWIGQNVLAQIPTLPSEIGFLASSFRADYLYGCIGADILFGKNLAEYRYHCHNWQVAQRLLKRARTDHHRAFAYGYLTHLAADVVSHNVFVPLQLVNFFYKNAFKHTYWEYCVERLALPELHVSFKSVFREAAKRNNDLLESNLTPTLLTFRTNRLLFSGVLFLDRLRHRRHRPSVYLPEAESRAYLRLALGNALQFLREGRASPQYKSDPAGLQNIAQARELRSILRRTYCGKRAGKEKWKAQGVQISARDIPASPPYPLEQILNARLILTPPPA
ncbi:MAG: zinc dependent phospholipase C family protein [Nitrospirae bacterium]|nr:zinc dependent phospholipase C family protein [Nitrospirota bacterium]